MPDTSYMKEDQNGPKSRETIPGLGYSKTTVSKTSQFISGEQGNRYPLGGPQKYRPRMDNRGGDDTHSGLCWK